MIINGDCLEIMRGMPDNSVDAIVTDPPYGLGTVKDFEGLLRDWMAGGDGSDHVGSSGFMGRDWDKSVPPPVLWREMLRVMKPGAYALVFAGTRTQDLMGVSLRLAGFETVGGMMWVFGEGFPKGLDVGKALDKSAGLKRDVVGVRIYGDARCVNRGSNSRNLYGGFTGDDDRILTAPASPESEQWEGYRTQLKPAHEPILIVRKPLDGTVVENVLRWGCGAFNVDGSRVGKSKRVPGSLSKTQNAIYGTGLGGYQQTGNESGHNPNIGRYPSDLLLTHAHDCVEGGDCGESCPIRVMGERSGVSASKANAVSDGRQYANSKILGKKLPGTRNPENSHTDTGTAARYFWQCYPDAPFLYQGKATKKDRTCNGEIINPHPTVKPRALIKYLINLVMPPLPDAVLLDPFGGSGTAGVACEELGRKYILIEADPEFAAVAQARIDTVKPAPSLEERVAWLETQVKAQGVKIRKLEKPGANQLSLWDVNIK